MTALKLVIFTITQSRETAPAECDTADVASLLSDRAPSQSRHSYLRNVFFISFSHLFQVWGLSVCIQTLLSLLGDDDDVRHLRWSLSRAFNTLTFRSETLTGQTFYCWRTQSTLGMINCACQRPENNFKVQRRAQLSLRPKPHRVKFGSSEKWMRDRNLQHQQLKETQIFIVNLISRASTPSPWT